MKIYCGNHDLGVSSIVHEAHAFPAFHCTNCVTNCIESWEWPGNEASLELTSCSVMFESVQGKCASPTSTCVNMNQMV